MVFLLLLNLFLIFVGWLMDIFSAIVVVVPLIVPSATHSGSTRCTSGIIFLANMELGYLTPPVGLNLFLVAYRFKKPVPEVARAVVPMILVLLVGSSDHVRAGALDLAAGLARALGRSDVGVVLLLA